MLAKNANSERRILIVEDDPEILEILSEILTLESFITVKANDCHLALEKLNQERFDLVVCDIEIPNLSGLQLFEAVRSLGNLTPVIFLSSNLSDSKKLKASGLSPYAIFPKPFNIDDFLNTIYDVFEDTSFNKSLY